MATLAARVQFLDDRDPFSSTHFPEPTRPPNYTFLTNVPLANQLAGVHKLLKAPHKLEDCTLQLYRYSSSGQGEYGTYLDLEATLDEQSEEIEGFGDQRKNSLLLRTQLSVRVHAVIEKLLNSDGRELRRALFSLKQIFQDDKDLVHEFVNSDGLDCLIKVGSEADQNHQNYILRALGQVMLYVDGMNGVIGHNETVQWLYSLISSKFRLVAKTALKLLLVFVEYSDANAQLLIKAVITADTTRGMKPWASIMDVLSERDGGDSELCLFAMTLINKTLSAVPDQDTFYDMTDCLEEQGMEEVIKRHVNKKGTDLDLITQLNLYEAALKQEDGDDEESLNSSQDIRQMPRLKSEGVIRISRRSMGSGGGSTTTGRSSPRSQRRMLNSRTTPEPELSLPSSQSVQMARRSFQGQGQNQWAGSDVDSVGRSATSPGGGSCALQRTEKSLAERHSGMGEPSAAQGLGVEPPTTAGELSFLEKRRAERAARKAELSATAVSSKAPVEGLANGQALPLSTTGASSGAQLQSSPRKYERRSALQDVSAVLQGTNSGSAAAAITVAASDRSAPVGLNSSNSSASPQSLSAQQRSPQSYALRQNRRERHISHYRQHDLADLPRPRMDEPLVAAKPAMAGFAAGNDIGSAYRSTRGAAMHGLDEPLYVRRMREQQDTTSASSAKPELQKLETGASVSPVVASDHQSSDRGLRTDNEATRRDNSSSEVSSRSSRDMSNRLSRSSQQNLLDEQGKVVSPLTPGVMSNNRRWMLYKMAKQSSEEVPTEPPPPTPSLGPHPMVVEGLVSRIEKPEADPTRSPGMPTVQTPTVVLGGSPASPPSSSVHALAGKLTAGSSGNDDVASIRLFPSSSSTAGGTVSVAKEKLANSSSSPALAQRGDLSAKGVPVSPPLHVDVDSRWESIEKAARAKKLRIKDMDFTDLTEADDVDVTQPVMPTGGGVPFLPPPPLLASGALPLGVGPAPPPPALFAPPPPMLPLKLGVPFQSTAAASPSNGGTLGRARKTIRLHWTEVSANVPPTLPQLQKQGTIWKGLQTVTVDTEQLSHLFESRASEAKAKEGSTKPGETKKVITVLDSKRSNVINIGLTKLPPPRTIKAAILKMDASIMTREGVEKILTVMLPTDEETSKIMEAQVENPDVPLGNAEQCLLVLSSVSELQARLELWLFKLDYELIEKEIAEPLMDLKEGLVQLQANKTFKNILATTLAIGNFLNGVQNQGFHIEYLAKVPEVKDTVHKHSLLHHICVTVLEKFPESSDLYSDINGLVRCNKVDWDELQDKLRHLEGDCRKSMDNLRLIAKHDSQSNTRIKMSEFLSDCAERIIVLQIVWGRVINRYHKMLIYFGLTTSAAKDLKVNVFCKIVSEFALEYRTAREKVLQQSEKKKTYKERKKTRGKLIVDVESDSTGVVSDGGSASKKDKDNDDQLKNILKNGYSSDVSNLSGSLGSRRRPSTAEQPTSTAATPRWKASGGSTVEADDTGDEVLEAAFRTATNTRVRSSEERKRSQYRHRKSLRRTLKGGISDAEKQFFELHAQQQNLHNGGKL